MPAAIKQYGLMEEMSFSEEQITYIANYIYDTEQESPGWSDKSIKEEQSIDSENENIVSKLFSLYKL